MRIILKKVYLWFLVLLMLFVTICGPVLVNAEVIQVNVKNPKELIDKASYAQIVAHAMKKCVKQYDSEGDYINTGSDIATKGIFTNKHTLPGTWLEFLVTGKHSDNKFWCEENKSKILDLFADVVGVTPEEVVCNKNKDYNGRVAGLLKDGRDGGKDQGDYSCLDQYKSGSGMAYNNGWTSIQDKDGNVVAHYTGLEYLEELYRDAAMAKNNPYWVSWDKIDDYTTGERAYYPLVKDFEIACGVSDYQNDGSNHVTILVADNAKIVKEVTKSYKSSNKTKSMTGTDRTCGELAELIKSDGDYAKQYKAKLESAMKVAQIDSCSDDDAKEQIRKAWDDAVEWANEVLYGNPDSFSEEDRQTASSILAQFSGDTGDVFRQDNFEFQMYGTGEPYIYHYSKVNSDGSVECRVPPSYASNDVTVEESVDEYEDPDADSGTVEQDPCYSNGGALGWILCPIISGIVDLGSQAYQWIEENFLQMSSLIFTDDSSGVKEVWNNIRDIANIGFVIILLFVIFSQLTGVGIDNYGIKKILPKLIVCAIMVNLSYYICELAIDLSNIVGSSLKTMLSSMGPTLTVSTNAPSGWQSAAVLGGGAVLIAVIAFFAYGGIGAILMLFIALLSCLLAVLTLFVILIIRQAGVVVCVIIAPLAMLCYVLPNTDKLYKRWWGLLKGLLIVYPICGLVVGAGSLMSRIFGNLSNGATGWLQLGFALSAMLVEVLPFFAVPTLLKSSLAAMGNIGAKISGIGRGLGNKAGSKIKGSDAMKMSKQRANDSKMMRKAGYNEKTGKLNAIGRAKAKFANTKVGSAIGYKRMQASNVQAAGKIASMNKEASASLSSETTAADIEAYMKAGKGSEDDYWQEQINSAGASGDTRKLDAAILTAQKRGKKPKDIMKWLRNAEGDGHLDFGGDEVAKANWMNRMLQEHGDIVSTDIEMQDWMRNSMTKDPATGKMRELGKNFGDYAKNYHMKPSDFDVSDLAKASGSSIAGLISADLISSSVAEQYLVSNPNASVDKKIMMGAVKDGKIVSDNAQAIKDDADSLSKDRGVASGAGISSATTFDEVKAWTAPMADRVTIDQQKPNEIPVEVYLRGGSGGKRRRK